MQKLTDTTTFTRSEIEAMHTNFKNMSKIQNDDGLIDKTEFKSVCFFSFFLMPAYARSVLLRSPCHVVRGVLPLVEGSEQVTATIVP